MKSFYFYNLNLTELFIVFKYVTQYINGYYKQEMHILLHFFICMNLFMPTLWEVSIATLKLIPTDTSIL